MEILFFLASVIVAVILASQKKDGEDKRIKALPQLAEDLKLKVISSNKNKELLNQKLEGTYNGFNLHIRFEKGIEQNLNDKLSLIIKIDLNILSPHYYEITALHTALNSSFTAHFYTDSSDKTFRAEQALEESKDRLIEEHALFRGSSIKIRRGLLEYEGVNYLEDEEDLQNFKKLLLLITTVAKDIKRYIQDASIKNYPFFRRLGQQLTLKLIEDKEDADFYTFQTFDRSMPIILYKDKLPQGELVYLSLQLEKEQLVAKFFIQLTKALTFDLQIFSDQSNAITRWFKGQDIEIRDDEFDEAFVIQSNDPLQAKQLLVHQDFRTSLLELNTHPLKHYFVDFLQIFDSQQLV